MQLCAPSVLPHPPIPIFLSRAIVYKSDFFGFTNMSYHLCLRDVARDGKKRWAQHLARADKVQQSQNRPVVSRYDGTRGSSSML